MGLNILIIGNCGVGKTYTIKRIISRLKLIKEERVGLINSIENENYCVAGRYDGSTFEGSDKLSMSMMTSLDDFLLSNKNKTVFYEGDRFMNSNFIKKAQPFIIKITGSGIEGRKKRQSNQSSRHLSSILTRVNNITPSLEVESSEVCYELLIKCITDANKPCEVLFNLNYMKKIFKNHQPSMF